MCFNMREKNIFLIKIFVMVIFTNVNLKEKEEEREKQEKTELGIKNESHGQKDFISVENNFNDGFKFLPLMQSTYFGSSILHNKICLLLMTKEIDIYFKKTNKEYKTNYGLPF